LDGNDENKRRQVMKDKDEALELIKKLIDRLRDGDFDSTYDFGFCKGLIYARDILEGKETDDHTELSWPEQFQQIHINDVSYAIAALASALDPEAAKKGNKEQLEKIISNIVDKLDCSLNFISRSDTTFVQIKKIDESFHEKSDLQDLLPVCDQESTVQIILARKILDFTRNNLFYESSYHFGAFCELIAIYNSITDDNLPTPSVPKVFHSLASPDVLLAAMLLAKNDTNSDRAKEIYEQIQNNADYNTIQDIRNIGEPEKILKVDLSDPNIVKA
jgi:hypothetical protein